MNPARPRALALPALTVFTACLLAVTTGPATAADDAGDDQRRPNIIFILIDDMGWADVGAFGSTLHETPNIDGLAAEGMKFTNAYAASPVCSPTRSSIMTGRNPARLQLTNFLKGNRTLDGSPILPAEYADHLPPQEVTIAETLKSVGYATGHIGKWHLSRKDGRGEDFPQHQGFDVNIAGGVWGSPPGGYFLPNQLDLPNAEEGEYLTDRLSREASEFIEANRDQPFFLYLAHYNVHIPIQAKEEMVDQYRAKIEADPPGPNEQDNPIYAAMVESVDQSVGRVLDTLDRLDLDDNTIIVFFSDNGGLSVQEGPHTPATTNHPLRDGKGYLYEGGIREPCIIRWPGVTEPESASDEPIISDDFFPTLCRVAGIDPQSVETRGPLDGVSITALLRDPDAELDRRALYWHYPHFSNQGGRPGGAVRVGDWKLIERYERGDLELYNLADDLGETKNLADEMPDRAGQLHQMLIEWREKMNANMPRPNPDHTP